MKKQFAAGLVLMIALLVSVTAIAQRKDDAVAKVFALVNKHRVEIGLKPLKMHTAISAEAARHSRNMANGNVAFGHDGFDGRYDKLTAAIKGANSMAENVACNTGTPEQIVDNWLHSPNHKKNIEGDFTITGIGMAKGVGGRIYYTQIFIKN